LPSIDSGHYFLCFSFTKESILFVHVQQRISSNKIALQEQGRCAYTYSLKAGLVPFKATIKQLHNNSVQYL